MAPTKRVPLGGANLGRDYRIRGPLKDKVEDRGIVPPKDLPPGMKTRDLRVPQPTRISPKRSAERGREETQARVCFDGNVRKAGFRVCGTWSWYHRRCNRAPEDKARRSQVALSK